MIKRNLVKIKISKIFLTLIITVLVAFLVIQISCSNLPFVLYTAMMMMSLMTSDEGDINGVLTMLGDVT